MAKEVIKAGSKTGSKKTEPASKNNTTAPKPPNKGKKSPVKETVTPAPAPDKELQTRLEILEQSNAELKKELIEAKWQNKAIDKKNDLLQRAKETISDLEDKLQLAEARANATIEDTRGWLNRGNKWVFAAIPVLILGVWIFFLNHHNNQLEKTVQDKNAVIDGLRNQLQNLKDEVDYDTTHAANNAIQAPDAEGSKKKIQSGNKP